MLLMTQFPDIFNQDPTLFTRLTPTQQENLCLFIKRASLGSKDMIRIQNFLKYHVHFDGLHHALTLFDICYSYNPSDMDSLSDCYEEAGDSALGIMSKMLSNPLCQVIFTARCRTFSDYSKTREPLMPAEAAKITLDITTDPDITDKKIGVFFDFFAHYRPFPLSQKDLMSSDERDQRIEELIQRELEKIRDIDDPVHAKKMIHLLLAPNKNALLFDTIKYNVAAQIELEDWHSRRRYDDLMEEIRSKLNQNQVDWQPIIKQLQQITLFDACNRYSFLPKSPSPVDDADATPSPTRGLASKI